MWGWAGVSWAVPGAVGYVRMWWPHRVVRGASEGKTGLLAKGELQAVPGRRGALSASQRRVFIYLFQVDVMSALGTVQTSEAASIPILLTVFEPRSHGPSCSRRWSTSGLGLLETPSRGGRGSGLLQRQQQIPAALTGWFSSKDLEVLDSQTRLFGVMVFAGPMACLQLLGSAALCLRTAITLGPRTPEPGFLKPSPPS